jgi:O-antigen/teichoic acid export membrane protein
MKPQSLKINYILVSVRFLLNLLIPLIIFFRVSRIFEPETFGKVEYANSIASYFILFALLGIPVYGVREIARTRDNDIEMSKTVWEISIILFLTNFLAYCIYFLFIYSIPSLYENRLLFFVVAPNILLQCFNYEWFYIGIEDQLYITIRYIITKIIQLALILFLVKNNNDYIIYAGILIGISSFSTLFNIARLRKYIRFTLIFSLNIKRHIKPVLLLFGSTIAVSIYTSMNVTMVGALVGDEAVGIYVVSYRIVRMIDGIVQTIGTVMVPRLESVLNHKNIIEYHALLNSTLRYIAILSIPLYIGVVILSPEIIELFVGRKYTASIIGIRLLSPVILILGLSLWVGSLIILPNRMERHYTFAVSAAAVVNFIINLLLIPVFKQNGAIIGTIAAEMTALIIMVCFGYRLIHDAFAFNSDLLKYIFASTIMAIVVILLKTGIEQIYIRVFACVFFGTAVYVIGLLVLQEKIMCSFIKRFIRITYNFLSK